MKRTLCLSVCTYVRVCACRMSTNAVVLNFYFLSLFSSERPGPPTVSCDPQTYVLENTNVTCTCRTTSLGHPAGFLRWTTGNQTMERRLVKEYQKVVKSRYIRYSQTLTLSDHDRTWLRCDVMWGTSEIRGENYTARVGRKSENGFIFNC